jgi:hypothetical protein
MLGHGGSACYVREIIAKVVPFGKYQFSIIRCCATFQELGILPKDHRALAFTGYPQPVFAEASGSESHHRLGIQFFDQGYN